MNDLKRIIAANIIDLRKSMKITQAELAEKLNYSDKAVSKWERAESLPDIIILKQIADLFGVTVDYLLCTHEENESTEVFLPETIKKNNHLIITLLSVSLVWLIATIVFVVIGMVKKSFLHLGIIYITAVPVSTIVLLVFNSIWGKRKYNFLIITVLLWTTLTTLYLSFLNDVMWLLFLIGLPGQVLIILWSRLKIKK